MKFCLVSTVNNCYNDDDGGGGGGGGDDDDDKRDVRSVQIFSASLKKKSEPRLPPPPPPPIRKPAILRRVRIRNGTFHRAIASSAKRLVLKNEPRSKRASKVGLLRADSFLGRLYLHTYFT